MIDLNNISLQELIEITNSSDYYETFTKEERNAILVKKVRLIRERVEYICSTLPDTN